MVPPAATLGPGVVFVTVLESEMKSHHGPEYSIAAVGRCEIFRRSPTALSRSQAALNSALAVSRSGDEPIGRPPARWMVTLQRQMHGMRSVAKRIQPMRYLPSNTAKSLKSPKRTVSMVSVPEFAIAGG